MVLMRNDANAELLFNMLTGAGTGTGGGSLNNGGYGHNFSTPSMLPQLMGMQSYSPLNSAVPFSMPYTQRGNNPYAEGGWGYQRQPNYIDTVLASGGSPGAVSPPGAVGYQNYGVKNPYGNGFVERNTAQMGMGIGSADPDPRPMGWQNDYSAQKRNRGAGFADMMAAWQKSMQPPKTPKPVNRNLHRSSPPSYGGSRAPANMPPATTQPQMPAQPANLNVQTAVGQGLPQYDFQGQLNSLLGMGSSTPWNQIPAMRGVMSPQQMGEINTIQNQGFRNAYGPALLELMGAGNQQLRQQNLATQQATSTAGLQALDYLLGRQNALYAPQQFQSQALASLLGMIGGGLRGL